MFLDLKYKSKAVRSYTKTTMYVCTIFDPVFFHFNHPTCHTFLVFHCYINQEADVKKS